MGLDKLKQSKNDFSTFSAHYSIFPTFPGPDLTCKARVHRLRLQGITAMTAFSMQVAPGRAIIPCGGHKASTPENSLILLTFRNSWMFNYA